MVSAKQLLSAIEAALLAQTPPTAAQRVELMHAIRLSLPSLKALLSYPAPKASDRAQVQSKEVRLPDAAPISLDDQDVHIARRRRRRTGNDFFDDEFDPDEIFRDFFGQRDMFRTAQAYRARTHTAAAHQREDLDTGPSLILLLQVLPFLIMFLIAYLPFSEPEYSLQKNYSYQFKKMTEKHGVEFFVKSTDFDWTYPSRTPSRHEIEHNVIKDYKHMIGRYCHREMQRRQWNRHFPTPHCDRLQSFAA